ncbi:MAG: hypothetical protein ACRDKT_16460 [Actinomycetota bacterium]
MKRTIAIALVAAAVILGACGNDADVISASSSDDIAVETAELIDRDTFRDDVRALWEDHIAWTRLYIVSAVDGLKDTDVTAARLLRNQKEIGDAIKPLFGDEAGNHLTELLNEHILTAADLIAAAKEGDDAAVTKTSKAWYRNGDEIADFLSTAGIAPRAATREMMKGHLDTTLDEAVARLTGDYEAEIKAYDEVRAHILHMADALANGIIAAMPERFAEESDSSDAAQIRRDVRALWEDHIVWTRLFIVSAVDGLADIDVTAARLLRNQTEIGDAIKPIFGDEAGTELTRLLNEHILIAADLIRVAKAGDDAAVTKTSKAWYRNGNEIADFLATAGVGPRAALRDMMKVHLDTTLAEAVARLTGDHEAEIEAYDAVRTHILHMADALAEGLAAVRTSADATYDY